jgi:glutathione S-transferase
VPRKLARTGMIRRMPARLYTVHGSHPCLAVEKALELKGIPFKKVEFPPPSQALLMRPLFGGRTVPGLKFEDGEKLQGSGAIMRALDQRVPEPRLYGSAEIEEAERWGDEVFQAIARRLLWAGFQRDGRAMYGYQEGQANPKLPMPVVAAAAPVIVAIEKRLNDVSDATVKRELAELPGHLDRIDAWIDQGLLGGDPPNAADLQIFSSVWLMRTLGDLKPLFEGRPLDAATERVFGRHPASTPAGVLPSDWLPAQSRTAHGAPA